MHQKNYLVSNPISFFFKISGKNIVLAAVRQNGLALQYAPENLKADSAIVLAAVQQNGEALLYAPEALKTDSKIVLAVEKQNQRALQGVPQESTSESRRDRVFNGFTSPMINFKKRITGAPSTSSSGGPANDTPKTPLLGENNTTPRNSP